MIETVRDERDPTGRPRPANATPADRRPIASRNSAWARRLSSALVRIGVSPNAVSTAGLLSGCLAGAAFAATAFFPDAHGWGFAAAAVLIQLRLLCNLLDGMVAVEGGRRSPVGELYNEAPDRISDAATLVGAGYALGATALWGWAAACTAIWVAYVRTLAQTVGAPSDFCGPMAKPHRMALMTAVALFLAMVPDEAHPSFSLIDGALAVVVAGGLLTSFRRLLRAARHLRGTR